MEANCPKREKFPRKFRITKDAEVRFVIKNGRRLNGKFLYVIFCSNSYGYRKWAISISKKTGGAVVRNLQKRRIREIIRHNQQMFPEGMSFFVGIRGNFEEFGNITYRELEEDLLGILRRFSKR